MINVENSLNTVTKYWDKLSFPNVKALSTYGDFVTQLIKNEQKREHNNWLHKKLNSLILPIPL